MHWSTAWSGIRRARRCCSTTPPVKVEEDQTLSLGVADDREVVEDRNRVRAVGGFAEIHGSFAPVRSKYSADPQVSIVQQVLNPDNVLHAKTFRMEAYRSTRHAPASGRCVNSTKCLDYPRGNLHTIPS